MLGILRSKTQDHNRNARKLITPAPPRHRPPSLLHSPTFASHRLPARRRFPIKRPRLPSCDYPVPPSDSLWSRQRLPSQYGLGPDLAQPSSCLCSTCASRFQQHSPPASCRRLRRNLSAFSFCLLSRPLTSLNFSCRIGRHQRFFLSQRKRPDLAQLQASASPPSSHLNTAPRSSK